MVDIKLIFFENCPNYETIKNLLLRSRCEFEEINQNKLPENHPLKKYTSPTILKNGVLIIGEQTSSFCGGCSILDERDIKKIENLRS